MKGAKRRKSDDLMLPIYKLLREKSFQTAVDWCFGELMVDAPTSKANSSNGSGATLGIVRLLIAVVIPTLAGALSAHFSTQSDIRNLNTRLEHAQSASEDLSKELDDLRADARLHMASGPDGLPHPQGVIHAIDGLKKRVQALEK